MSDPSAACMGRPLLRRSPLEPGESLPSLLARLKILNGYSSPALLERLILPDYPDRPDCPSQKLTFDRLSALTGVLALDLYAASDHCFTQANLPGRWPMVSAQEVPILDFPSLSSAIHPTNASWYCPKCLEESAYHRLIWRPAAISACLEHTCLLVNHCPQCRGPVSIYDIIRLHCSQCGADLRRASAVTVNEDEVGQLAQATMQGRLLNHPVPDRNWPQQPSKALCSLADGLALGMFFLPRNSPFGFQIPGMARKPRLIRCALQRLEPNQDFRAYAAAVQCMTDWPEGFRTFLYRCEPDPKCELRATLKSLYAYWTTKQWNNPSILFIWEEFNRFHTDRVWFASGFSDREMHFSQLPAYAGSREAALMLGVPENVLLRLGQMNVLSRTNIRHFNASQSFYLHRELRKMKQSWDEPLSLQEAACWLGLATETVTRLTKEHILKVSGMPKLHKEQGVFFTKSEIADLVSQVDNCATSINHQTGLVHLRLAAQQLECVHLDEAKLLGLVLSHQLAAYRSFLQQRCWECGEISFRQKDLDALMDSVASQKEWIAAEKAAFRVCVEDTVFLAWIDRGLLKPVAVYNEQPYLKQNEIDRFLSQYIFFEEAMRLLGVTFRPMMNYIQCGTLIPVAGPGVDGCDRYLLLRSKVESLAKRLKVP
jgi:hypothetical protein